MGFFNRIGQGIKNAFGKVKEVASNTFNRIGSGIQTGLHATGGLFNRIGRKINDGKEWLYKVPVLGTVAQGLGKFTGADDLVNGISGGLQNGGNLLGQLADGDLSGMGKSATGLFENVARGAGYGSALDLVKNGAEFVKNKGSQIIKDQWPKSGSQSINGDYQDRPINSFKGKNINLLDNISESAHTKNYGGTFAVQKPKYKGTKQRLI
jgi:hypothetical protein